MNAGQAYRWHYASFTEALRELARVFPFTVLEWWHAGPRPAHEPAPRCLAPGHDRGLAVDVVFSDPQPAEDMLTEAARVRRIRVTRVAGRWHLEYDTTEAP